MKQESPYLADESSSSIADSYRLTTSDTGTETGYLSSDSNDASIPSFLRHPISDTTRQNLFQLILECNTPNTAQITTRNNQTETSACAEPLPNQREKPHYHHNHSQDKDQKDLNPQLEQALPALPNQEQDHPQAVKALKNSSANLAHLSH